MEDLRNRIPLELTQTLNKFNKELDNIQSKVEMITETKSIRVDNSNREQIIIEYRIKNSKYFFNISFVDKLDKINWKYYPYNNTSTMPKSNGSSDSNGDGIYERLGKTLSLWRDIVSKVHELENPIDYFKVDKFIKFYSDEILIDFPVTEEQKQFPISSSKQEKAILLLAKQKEFLQKELEDLKDKSSEKYSDLKFSHSLVEKIEEELPRLTEEEVKRNWSISLGGIKKWCADKFFDFLIVDKASNYNFSRSLGSFFGGVFGAPNLGG
jgi:hypothetical protein